MDTAGGILIPGHSHDVVLQWPMFGTGEPVRWWAENGLVCFEDGRNDEYGTMTWQEALTRMKALSDMAKNTRDEGFRSDELERLKQFVMEMVNVINKAKIQGAPDDITGMRAKIAARPTSVSIPENMIKPGTKRPAKITVTESKGIVW